MRGNGRLKGCFWRVRFFSAPVRFALKTSESLKWEEKKRTLQNTLLDDRFSARRLLRSFGAPPRLLFQIIFPDYVIFFTLQNWLQMISSVM